MNRYSTREAQLLFRDQDFRWGLSNYIANSSVGISGPNTGSITLSQSNVGTLVLQNSASANNVTVPDNTSAPIPIGASLMINNMGAGQTTIVAGAGVTLNSADGALKLRAQHSTATLIKIGINTWLLVGDLTT